MPPKPILPPRLRPGSRVALLTPSGPLLERDHCARGVELCRALGYEPVVMPNAGNAHGYLGGSDVERLADLNAALTDPAYRCGVVPARRQRHEPHRRRSGLCRLRRAAAGR